MVKFGERLPTLMVAAWKDKYIDYERLKAMLEDGALDAAASSTFYKELAAEIGKVDAFVAKRRDELRAGLDGSTPVTKLSKELDELRSYVGTNLVAATKIVKKHDKNVAPELSKRERVAALVNSCAGLNGVPELQRKIDQQNSLKANDKKSGAALEQVRLAARDIDATNDVGDENDTETTLRSLPYWLLAGAQADAAAKENAGLMYMTYLVDWDLEEAAPLAGSFKKEGVEVLADDKWIVDFSSDAKSWGSLTGPEKVKAVAGVLLKLTLVVAALYFFICSLSFLASGFRLVAGRQAGMIFRNSLIFNNPIAGVLVGVLVTVLVQSSSTSTSIVITMVAADLFTVKQAIPLIMGANIGTSVTSTIVALGQSLDRGEFRRAFAAATVHDMFNFLSVLVLLPLEAASGYLYHFSLAIINSSPSLTSGDKPPDILKVVTKPFTKLVISIDKKVITKIANAETQEDLDELEGTRMLKHFLGIDKEEMSDGAAGAIILVAALVILCFTLFMIVYLLKLLLRGRIAVWMHRSVNGQVPDIKCGDGCKIPMQWAAGWLAMGSGVLITLAVQSSSITTSALTPLVGIGVIQVERMYPMVLGANIGTCVTGVLAALAADGSKLKLTLQVACAHLIFNITGIFMWYVIWPLRALPINAAKFLGATTAKYRWFAIAYLFTCFFFVPLIIFGISIGSTVACTVVVAIFVAFALAIGLINTLQAKKPSMLPAGLRSWAFLPKWMKSLEPLDRVVCGPLGKVFALCACKCCKKAATKPEGQMSTHDIEVAAQRLGATASKTGATGGA